MKGGGFWIDRALEDIPTETADWQRVQVTSGMPTDPPNDEPSARFLTAFAGRHVVVFRGPGKALQMAYNNQPW